MERSVEEVQTLVDAALVEIERQTKARVLIVEDDPVIAMDIESIVHDLGHTVAGLAITHAEAVSTFQATNPTLVLADIQLADDSSGIDAVKDMLAVRGVPVIFVTGFPERLLTGQRPEPTFLVTKPFQHSTLKAAISQALFFDAATLPLEEHETADDPVADEAPLAARFDEPSATADKFDMVPTQAEIVPSADLQQLPAPIMVEVVNGQLRAGASKRPRSRLSYDTLQELAQHHAAFAAEMIADFADNNAARDAVRWMRTLHRALDQPLTETTAIRFAGAADALLATEAELRDQLTPLAAATFLAFGRQVRDLANQFYEIRTFRAEAAEQFANADEMAALVQVAEAIAAQPLAVVTPEVSEVLREAAELRLDSPALQIAAARTAVGNVLRAVASWCVETMKAAGAKTKEKVAEAASTYVVGLLGTGATLLLMQLSGAASGAVSAGVTAFLISVVASKSSK